MRRAAIHVLWQVPIEKIDAAVDRLTALLSHNAEFTRAMAAITLGGKRVDESFHVIADMALKDKSAYARRCAAYVLGLAGREDALVILDESE